MKIDEKNNVSILLNLLKERYNASHKMRERSLNFAIWILGFAIAIIWILISGISLTTSQKWIFTVFIVIIGFLAFLFLRSIEKGFINNRRVMIDIETALGCYKEGIYVYSKTLFPASYKTIKLQRSVKYLTTHFGSIYILIVIIPLTVILLTWCNPKKDRELPTENQKIEQIDKMINR